MSYELAPKQVHTRIPRKLGSTRHLPRGKIPAGNLDRIFMQGTPQTDMRRCQEKEFWMGTEACNAVSPEGMGRKFMNCLNREQKKKCQGHLEGAL